MTMVDRARGSEERQKGQEWTEGEGSGCRTFDKNALSRKRL